MKKLFLLVILCFFGAELKTSFASSDTLERYYSIEADFRSLESRTYEMTLHVRLKNHGQKALEEVWLVLFPNRYRQELPYLTDVNYLRVYPDGFSQGEIAVQKIYSKDNKDLEFQYVEHPNLPKETLAKVTLDYPLQPGNQQEFSIHYWLKVPEKFGSFGYYRGYLTLAGGWYPYIPVFDEIHGFQAQHLPPLASWDLSFKADQSSILMGKYRMGPIPLIQKHFSRERELILSIGKEFALEKVKGKEIEVLILTQDQNQKSVIRPLKSLIRSWIQMVEAYPFLTSHTKQLTLVQAPIRMSLVSKSGSILFFSDRAFKLIGPLQKYHTVPLLHGLFYQLIYPKSSQVEDSLNYHWITEAVAWAWTEQFMKEKEYRNRDARTLGPIKTLSFLTAIDRVIYSPQFAFFDVFYNLIYPVDPIRDHPLRFQHRRPYGRTIYAHLEDELGPKTAAKIAQVYLQNPDQMFKALAKEISNRSLDKKFAQWNSPRPRINYALKKHKQRKTGSGFEHEVTVVKESPVPWPEPVELTFITKDKSRFVLVKNQDQKEMVYKFQTKKRVRLLEVDPRHRLLETKLGDNRKPPKYKLVITQLLLGYDFNSKQPELFVSSQLRKSFGSANRYNFSASYAKDTYSFGVGYSRLFGRLLDRLRLSHGLSVGLGFARLDGDQALAIDPAVGNTAVQEVGPEGNSTTVGLSYFFGNQVSFTNPLQGGWAGISATWGTQYLGGDFDYYRWSVGSSWIIPFHPSHLLAVRGLLGGAGPSDIPSQVQFALGGIAGIRGLPLDDDRQRGRNILLTSAEYRHFLLKDIDLNLWLFRVRDIQGALFTAAGRVTDTVQERANQLAFGALDRTTFGDLFDVSNFEADVGYGIRFHVEYLGVDPGLLRFDAAKSISDLDTSVRFYFGVTQSF